MPGNRGYTHLSGSSDDTGSTVLALIKPDVLTNTLAEGGLALLQQACEP